MKRFEMLWYNNKECKGDFETKEFSTFQAMVNFYNKNKNGKYMIMLTKRSITTGAILEVYKY